MCLKMNTNEISFVRLHEMCQRATPERFLLYKHALTLYKLLNGSDQTIEWVAINCNQVFTSRQIFFTSIVTNLKRVGLNALANRLNILNGRISLMHFNKNYDTFKVFCKNEFFI